ncbi:MAG: hypothetical protein AAB909_01030 [Patescibacteria group bacterium]
MTRLLIILLLLLSVYKLLHLSDLDIIRINTRRSYYPKSAGRLFQNKFTESFTLARKQFFSWFKI